MDLYPQDIGLVTVNELQEIKFSHLSFNEKDTVKKRGRFTLDTSYLILNTFILDTLYLILDTLIPSIDTF